MLAAEQVQILYSRQSNEEAVTAIAVSTNAKKRALYFIYVQAKRI